MWTIEPSPQAVKALLAFWRETGEDGQIRYDLTDPDWNTRFLGDLYQDLSEAARKTYALLQTPEFVEEFILNYTLDPAIEEFGLEPEPPVGHEDLPPGLRVIDPACGSGHFLLGAFRRLLSAWETASPTTDRYELVAKALSSVHGVDKNPFAAAIARFRLMLAAMRAAGVDRLTERVDFPINIAVGDSLLHGKGAPGRQGEFDFGGEAGAWTYRTEDVEDYIKSCHILEYGSYHVVVANPPYITVKDKAENESIRKRYEELLRQVRTVGTVRRADLRARRPRLWLHGPDHRQLVHEARVRQEAHRGVLSDSRSYARHRHVWRLHPWPRHAHGDPHRPPPVRAVRLDHPRCPWYPW